ncbi:nitrogenase molybdenum-iron protein subunit beta [Gorillibacterium massiliense]|uniref:nitrogenase molybdenum-iron protein subunit beta n=1 Tax=Gorillibacterium massiliense TaxID=1280390 RepID=UPI0004BC5606|nr:nitrogenase molybdenum-iron protein subunit beta [Gorillibacterium massiliense]
MANRLPIKDHNTLFQQEKYKRQAENKKQFELACPTDKVEEVRAYTATEEYKEKNFARSSVVINPAKACQPLGAVLAGLGFEKTLPFVQGSQGCVAYFRSHLARHFKEPVPAVSSSMTEDGAVFGGMRNLIDGLQNSTALYKPEMIAMSTTCMAEVIGDDLQAFIRNARGEGAISQEFPVAYANTPSFIGSHITGYDAMMKGILSCLSERNPEAAKTPSGKINFIAGFDTYTGNFAELKRLLALMDVDYTILGDYSDNLDSPANGEYNYYYGGTKLADVEQAPAAAATIALQKYSTSKTMKYVGASWGHQTAAFSAPIGIGATDRLVSLISGISGKPVPAELIKERGRVVDAMADSHPYLHGKRVAMAGDPDMLLGLIGFCLEVGIEPVHIVCTNGDSDFEEEAKALLAASPYGLEGKVYVGKDLWHMRSLLLTEPVDFAIGSTYLKYAAKDAGIPLVRFGFPIFDRHHLHRFPIIGYQGALQVLVHIVNSLLDNLDDEAPDHSFDAVR